MAHRLMEAFKNLILTFYFYTSIFRIQHLLFTQCVLYLWIHFLPCIVCFAVQLTGGQLLQVLATGEALSAALVGAREVSPTPLQARSAIHNLTNEDYLMTRITTTLSRCLVLLVLAGSLQMFKCLNPCHCSGCLAGVIQMFKSTTPKCSDKKVPLVTSTLKFLCTPVLIPMVS